MEKISTLNVLKFAEARASEIASLMEDVKFKKNKTAVQKLPPHMRRRAASHNPKRVPRKLRESYLKQNPHATSKPKKAPKKMRKKQQKKKHEKQAKNYPEEYASRSKPGEIWLGTHIWHAKRCKMETLWGYKLPIRCNDKKLGATHQAATKHAMLQDLSYYCCISLEGLEDKLVNGLSQLTDPHTGNHFASETYLDGTREGHTFLYHPLKFPFEAIGPVTFIWKPTLNNVGSESQTISEIRSLWIWCHPTFHDELVQVLINIFKLQEVAEESVPNSSSTVDQSSKEKIKNDRALEEEIKFASKVNFYKVKQHYLKKNLYLNNDIKMFLLKDKLVRHRLVGPSAQSVLTNVLQIANIKGEKFSVKESIHEESGEDNDKKVELGLISSSDNNTFVLGSNLENSGTNSKVIKKDKESEIVINETSDKSKEESCDKSVTEPPNKKMKLSISEVKKEEVKSETSKHWWQSYYESENAKNMHTKQDKVLNILRNGRSNYLIPLSSVIGLTVRDPRLILNRNKEKFVPMEDCSDLHKCIEELLDVEAAYSPIWDHAVRDEVTATQISEHVINEERSKYIIPSESPGLGNRESRVPILLIHQTGINGFGTGWDLITPLGWSMAFWLPLVLNGGRVTGIRDLHFVNLEIGRPSFPLSYPDTKAGATFEEKQRLEEMTCYYRRPPSKRTNFLVFAVPNPYFIPWDVLTNDWEKELNKDNILFCDSDTTSENPNLLSITKSEKNDSDGQFFVLRQKQVRLLQTLCEKMKRLPKKVGEFKNLKKTFNELIMSVPEFSKALVLIRVTCVGRGCPSIHSGIFALDDSDHEQVKKKFDFLGPVEPNHNKKTDHKKNKEESSVEDSTFKTEKSSPKQEDSESSISNKDKSKNLDRPDIQTLKSCSSRNMIGYLSEGGFSSISGKGCGIGHCSFVGFLLALKNCINMLQPPLVLFREQHSFQYRLASVEIINNYL